MRKISPHVNIYSFPITAISSITNRVTGLAATGGYIFIGCSLLLKKNPIDYYEKMGKVEKRFINYGVLFPNIYHFWGGLRHMIWDKNPKLLRNISVSRSSYGLFFISIASTLFVENVIIKNDLKKIL